MEDALTLGKSPGLRPEVRQAAEDLTAMFKPLQQALDAESPRARSSPSWGQASSQALDALKDNGIDLRWTRTTVSPKPRMARKAKDLDAGMKTYKSALDQLVQLPGMTAARLETLWRCGTAESALAIWPIPTRA